MPKLKRLLKTLALLYLVIGTLALIPALSIISQVIEHRCSAESLVLCVLLLIFIPIPVLILMTCQRYLKIKDAKSASDISVLTGVFVFFLAAAVFPSVSTDDSIWITFTLILGPIAIGVYAHKLFQKYIDLHFDIPPKTRSAPAPEDVDAGLKKRANEGLL